MIIIRKKLNFELFKDNKLSIEKKGIEYSIINDKILFELDENLFEIILLEDNLQLMKRNNSSILKINKEYANIKLIEHNIELPLKVELFDSKINNKFIKIDYKLESDEELTTVNIIL